MISSSPHLLEYRASEISTMTFTISIRRRFLRCSDQHYLARVTTARPGAVGCPSKVRRSVHLYILSKTIAPGFSGVSPHPTVKLRAAMRNLPHRCRSTPAIPRIPQPPRLSEHDCDDRLPPRRCGETAIVIAIAVHIIIRMTSAQRPGQTPCRRWHTLHPLHSPTPHRLALCPHVPM